ncbi:MAG: rhodanese-like domain-containing protein [Gammaproteobacteria bacterium]
MATLRLIGAKDLHERIERGERTTIIDVREPEEYRALHAAGALLLPLAEVNTETVTACLAASQHSSADSLCFICHSGRRATEACEHVLNDFPTAIVIEGGTLAWAQAALPVHSGDEP